MSGSGSGPPSNDAYDYVTLNDVAGLNSQKKYLRDAILSHLQDKGKRKEWGLEPPKGVLFHGLPGTGKTLLARAFGNDLSKVIGKKVSFYHKKGGEFQSMFVGEAESRIREFFKNAMATKPSIIFLDELDGMIPSRNTFGVHQYHTSIIATFLTEMDNLPVGDVFVFGATNRVDSVDPAMRRPGRFDQHLEFFPPNFEDRKDIIKVHTRKWKRSHPNEMQLTDLANNTVGFTGADLENLCRTVFLKAFERHVPTSDLTKSIKDLEITKQDWNKALEGSRASDSTSFGSMLYTPPTPLQIIADPCFTRLARASVMIAENVKTLLEGKQGTGVGFGLGGGIQSAILLSQTKDEFDTYLDQYYLPAIFSYPQRYQVAFGVDLSKIPIYRLSKDDIQAESPFTRATVISKIFEKISSSLEPCILYMPRIDETLTQFENLISKWFDSLNGKQVVIVGTANQQTIQKNGLLTNWSKLFANGVEIIVPSIRQYESRLMLGPVIEAVYDINGRNGHKMSKEQAKEYQLLLEMATNAVEGKGLDSILQLHDGILRTGRRWIYLVDKTKGVEEVKGMIAKFNLDGFI